MKTALVSAIVVVILLLSSLLYWVTRPSAGATPGASHQASVAAPEPPVVLSKEAVEPPRSAAAPVETAAPALAGDLASPSGKTAVAVTTSIPEPAGAGNQVFEEKYAGMGSDARRK